MFADGKTLFSRKILLKFFSEGGGDVYEETVSFDAPPFFLIRQKCFPDTLELRKSRSTFSRVLLKACFSPTFEVTGFQQTWHLARHPGVSSTKNFLWVAMVTPGISICKPLLNTVKRKKFHFSYFCALGTFFFAFVTIWQRLLRLLDALGRPRNYSKGASTLLAENTGFTLCTTTNPFWSFVFARLIGISENHTGEVYAFVLVDSSLSLKPLPFWCWDTWQGSRLDGEGGQRSSGVLRLTLVVETLHGSSV